MPTGSPPRENGGYNIAVVGASTLKGKEVKELLESRQFPATRVKLLDAEEVGGQLTEFADEPAIIYPIDKDNFEDISIAIFAASPAFTEKHWRLTEESGAQVIDLSYYLEENPAARLSAPVLEDFWNAGSENFTAPIFVPAHPAAIAISGILTNLSEQAQIRRAVVVIYEPVSEHGKAGVDELHQQTVNLFSFQKLPKSVFDSQVAFNMLASFGEAVKPSLCETERRIRGHVRSLLPGHIPQPALRLMHVPVFYGYSFNCFVEFSEAPQPEAIQKALERKPFVVNLDPEMQPDIVGVAGSEEIQIGRLERDPAVETGYWIWGALDNLRFAALNAVHIAERLAYERVSKREPGKVE
jgi:aspartate-semialdehyde dehydrogenase